MRINTYNIKSNCVCVYSIANTKLKIVMATNKTSDGLPINSPPTYGSQDVENPPIPQESPPPYLPSPGNICMYLHNLKPTVVRNIN